MTPLLLQANSAVAALLPAIWQVCWQSSLFVLLVAVLDLAFRKRLSAATRYALWLLVLLKLLLPPNFALPSSPAWWLRHQKPSAQTASKTSQTRFQATITFPDQLPNAERSRVPILTVVPRLSGAVWCVLGSMAVTLILLARLGVHTLRLARQVSRSGSPSGAEAQAFERAKARLGLAGSVRLRTTQLPVAPALCGLWRPVILLPASLSQSLSSEQLAAVFLHELLHYRRRDCWVHTFQAILLSIFWWHPFLWWANSRLCRLREEAVDDAVADAMGSDRDHYPLTLLAVARFCVNRPVASLGLLSITEPANGLKRRIERLTNVRSAVVSNVTMTTLGLLSFAAVAMPMAEGPQQPVKSGVVPLATSANWPDPQYQGYGEVQLQASFATVRTSLSDKLAQLDFNPGQPAVLNPNQVRSVRSELRSLAQTATPEADPLDFTKFSGGVFVWKVGASNNSVCYFTEEHAVGTVVTGAVAEIMAPNPDWLPLELTVIPWSRSNSLLCELSLADPRSTRLPVKTNVELPHRGGLLWVIGSDPDNGTRQVILLETQPPRPPAKTSARVRDGTDLKLLKRSGADSAAVRTESDVPPRASHPLSAQASVSNFASLDSSSTPPAGPSPDYGTRKEVLNKLNSIVLPQIAFNPLHLSTAASELARRSKELDPDHRGINFIIGTLGSSNNPGSSSLWLPRMQNVTLLHVLDQLLRQAPVPLKYSIEDYGVVISPKSEESQPLATRVFKLEEKAASRFQNFPGGPRSFFSSHGINLTPPNSLFYTEGDRSLIVHSTVTDMNRIELELMALASPELAPPQLTFKVKFVSVPRSTNNEGLFTQLRKGITDPESLPSNPPTDAINTFVARLTDPQFRLILHALETSNKAELLNEASVTTLTGRQTEIGLGQDPPAGDLPSPLTIDLLGEIAGNNETIDLVAQPRIAEFLGYDDPADNLARDFPPSSNTNKPAPSPHKPLPRLRIRETTVNRRLYDGQTLMLGTLQSDDSSRPPKPKSSRQDSDLLIFITATIITPVGNPIHSANTFPEAADSFPPQPLSPGNQPPR